jgi:hypothetical protein
MTSFILGGIACAIAIAWWKGWVATPAWVLKLIKKDDAP